VTVLAGSYTKKVKIVRIASALCVRKSKRKQKNKMLLRHVTTSLSLRNYLSPPKRYAKCYSKYFRMIQ
jgi:hypothetical protein